MGWREDGTIGAKVVKQAGQVTVGGGVGGGVFIVTSGGV